MRTRHEKGSSEGQWFKPFTEMGNGDRLPALFHGSTAYQHYAVSYLIQYNPGCWLWSKDPDLWAVKSWSGWAERDGWNSEDHLVFKASLCSLPLRPKALLHIAIVSAAVWWDWQKNVESIDNWHYVRLAETATAQCLAYLHSKSQGAKDAQMEKSATDTKKSFRLDRLDHLSFCPLYKKLSWSDWKSHVTAVIFKAS